MSGAYQPESASRRSADASVRRRWNSPAPSPIALALLIVAAVTALRAFGSVDSDVSWQLWIARHLHQGAHLYRDIVETNPPLWFWMAVPIDALATVLRLRVDLVLIL